MEQLQPEQANLRLNQLWGRVGRQVLKLAVLQKGAGLMDATLMNLWRTGALGEAITGIYARCDAEFTAMTYRKRQAGVDIRRIHTLDDNTSPDEQAYLGLLIEYFRRINVPMGLEDIYLLPRSECESRGIVLPTTDIALFDDLAVVTTHYADTCIIRRDLYATAYPEDIPYVQAQIHLAQQLSNLLTPAHLLHGVGKNEPRTWVEDHRPEWAPMLQA